jgi:hypothetical protein
LKSAAISLVAMLASIRAFVKRSCDGITSAVISSKKAFAPEPIQPPSCRFFEALLNLRVHFERVGHQERETVFHIGESFVVSLDLIAHRSPSSAGRVARIMESIN